MKGTPGDAPREEDALSDAELLGIDLGDYQDNVDAEDGIWSWHLDALEAFLAISSQWRTVALGYRVVPTGLDYTAAQAGLQMAGLSIGAETWGEVRTIEQGALAELRRTL